MTSKNMNNSDQDPWENGSLGCDPEFVSKSSEESSRSVDEALGLRLVTLRLPLDVVALLKENKKIRVPLPAYLRDSIYRQMQRDNILPSSVRPLDEDLISPEELDQIIEKHLDGGLSGYMGRWGLQQFAKVLTEHLEKRLLRERIPEAPIVPGVISSPTKILEEAMSIYVPPFKYKNGYVVDSNYNILADAGSPRSKESVTSAVACRIRGWSYISSKDYSKKLLGQIQDSIGDMVAQSLNDFYARRKTDPLSVHQKLDRILNLLEVAKEPDLPDFEDDRVQKVYDILCDTELKGKPREEHWEGWQARRIVEALDKCNGNGG